MSLPRRKVPKDFPCNCGHAWKVHDWAGIPIGDEFCMADTDDKKYRCDCMMYVPDNLRYLEYLSKKKGKGKLK